MSGQSGYVHKFQVFGDTTVPHLEVPTGIGESGKVVLRMYEIVPRGTHLFFDNYFAFPALALPHERVIRKSRSADCPLLCEKDLKKKGRGAMDYHLDTEKNVLLCECHDNKSVVVGSCNRYEFSDGSATLRPWQVGARQSKMSQLRHRLQPKYGRVDKCDMLLSLYRNPMKTTK